MANPLPLSLNELRANTPQGVHWYADSLYGEVHSELVQLDSDRTLFWVSQSFRYASSDGAGALSFLHLNHRLLLQRDFDGWQVAEVKRTDGEKISHVQRSPQGRVIGVRTDNQGRQQIVELNHHSLQWRVNGKLPTPFWPLPDNVHVERLWAADKALLIKLNSHYTMPGWMFRENIAIAAPALYYSTTGGIPGASSGARATTTWWASTRLWAAFTG